MTARFAPADAPSLPITVLAKDAVESWLAEQDDATRAWVAANGFSGRLGQVLVLPGAGGEVAGALLGWGTPADRARGRFHFAAAAEALPAGIWHIESGLGRRERDEAALAWLLAGYRFDRYARGTPPEARLKAPDGVDAALIEKIAAADALARDLINTPASDMGPAQLEEAAAVLAAEHGAGLEVTRGDDLLGANLPLIHAVGRAAASAPRLLDLRWGDPGHPGVTLVGKGVCFDTGGLNLKPGSSMALMKKDMGGAATALGLARLIMSTGLPVRLRVLIPAVENAVSGASFRPGDILTSRKGLTVEVNNTDAEGRLVLADALALADEEAPEYLFCMATLTGAARVALGPDLVPFYTDDDSLSHALARAARKVSDPLWRMPFWAPYEKMIEPGIADLDNAPKGGFAGSITAALFLRRFVDRAESFAHFDLFAWNPERAPGRPKGAAFQAGRAIHALLRQKIGT